MLFLRNKESEDEKLIFKKTFLVIKEVIKILIKEITSDDLSFFIINLKVNLFNVINAYLLLRSLKINKAMIMNF